MSAPMPRNAFAAPSLGRLAGHTLGFRRLNGTFDKCSGVEREFRDEMMQLGGELLLLRNCEEEQGQALEDGIWDHIAGLHTVFGRSSRVDDLVGLLLVTREAIMAGELAELPLAEMTECAERMAFDEHTPALRLALSRKLRAAGVDMNRGF